MDIKRHKTRTIKIGNCSIGGNSPVAIQSMTKTATSNISATIKQIQRLQEYGCEIVRLAVNDPAAALAIKKIKKETNIPLVADIHFDWRLACEAINNGIDKIRLNPGNIYKERDIREIILQAKRAHIPVRIGANSGSIRNFDKKKSTAMNLVGSVLDYIKIIEALGFYELVVSLKAADIFDTIEAYRKIAELCNYPLHIGLTATGAPSLGIVKSSIAIGILLSQGLGDTIRVSLTEKPQEEVLAARRILLSLGLRSFGPQIISCPTCGRCAVNLTRIVKDLDSKLSAVSPQPSAKPTKVAVMGCVVNGPGEAKDADLGVAFEKTGKGLLFKKGKPMYKVSPQGCIPSLLQEMES